MNYPVLPRPLPLSPVPPCLGALPVRPRFSARLAAALRRFFLRDARRDAEDIAAGIVPTSRRHDRALVESMQREAMGGAQ